MTQIVGKRSIKMVELKSPNTIQVLFENRITNIGETPLNDIEFILPLPDSVELPGLDEVTVSLHGEPFARENVEIKMTQNEGQTDYVPCHVVLWNLIDAVGGLQTGEDLSLIFPVYINLDIEKLMFKYPLRLNALEGPDSVLIEEIAVDLPFSQAQTKTSMDITDSDAFFHSLSFENNVIDKFAKLAVATYNEGKFEDTLAYCDEILSIAQSLKDEP